VNALTVFVHAVWFFFCRNLVGGVGPVAVAKLAEMVGLQHAMLLAPCCYVVSGLIFLVAEKEIEQQQKQEKLLAQQQLAVEPLQQ
jgi:fucose permease